MSRVKHRQLKENTESVMANKKVAELEQELSKTASQLGELQVQVSELQELVQQQAKLITESREIILGRKDKFDAVSAAPNDSTWAEKVKQSVAAETMRIREEEAESTSTNTKVIPDCSAALREQKLRKWRRESSYLIFKAIIFRRKISLLESKGNLL